MLHHKMRNAVSNVFKFLRKGNENLIMDMHSSFTANQGITSISIYYLSITLKSHDTYVNKRLLLREVCIP